MKMLPFDCQCIGLPKQLSPAIHGCGFVSCLKLLADVLVYDFRRDFQGACQAEIVAHVLEMRLELCARRTPELVILLQGIEQFRDDDVLLPGSDESLSACAVRAYFVHASA